MGLFTIHIENRDYIEWKAIPQSVSKCENENENESIDLSNSSIMGDISPIDSKLFHKDIINSEGNLVSSFYRDNEEICGVLLTSEKTYGRNSKGKLLFKCIPDDEHLPCFLIPYEEKNIGFAKNKLDKYITFRIHEWKDKHPLGTLTNSFGNVNDNEAYINYQLTCNNLHDSLKQFNAISLRALRLQTLSPIPHYINDIPIEDRRTRTIISIDPKGCTDIDDAIGITTNANGEKVLSIYIANVPMMIEYLGLWQFITNRISTIYFPDKKIPMLPKLLSDNLCSLKEGEDRVAFILDIHIDNKNKQTFECNSAIINVKKNYVYNEVALTSCNDYQDILKTINKINIINGLCYTSIKYMDEINNSHDVIEYCMIMMNHQCSKMLREKEKGIFRSATKNTIETNNTHYEHLIPEVKYILENVSGEYCDYTNIKPHELVGGGLKTYTHITSPIRRIVDCVNMIELQQEKFEWSKESKEFLKKWMSNIEIINVKTKATNKLQNQMELMNEYEKNNNEVHDGIVFSKTTISVKGVDMFKYRVYIKLLNLLSNVVTTKDIKDYSTAEFSVHSFMDEIKMTKKLRLQML